jgi:hypothetical protein
MRGTGADDYVRNQIPHASIADIGVDRSGFPLTVLVTYTEIHTIHRTGTLSDWKFSMLAWYEKASIWRTSMEMAR